MSSLLSRLLSCSVPLRSTVHGCWLHAETSAVALILDFPLLVAPGLEACPAVPSFCQRRCLPRPSDYKPPKKTPKRPPGKVARSRLSGLMSKMFQSSGNLLQSGILSLFTSKNLCKEMREKWRKS